jgi:hypothetical protein
VALFCKQIFPDNLKAMPAEEANDNMFVYNKLTYIARKVWWRAGITHRD